MPLVFIIFYSCTIRSSSSRNSSSSTSQRSTRRTSTQNSATSTQTGLLSRVFYDPELTRSVNESTKSHVRRIGGNGVNLSSGIDSTAKNLLFSGADADTNHYPLLAAHHKPYTSTSSEPKLIYSKKLKPTPFELAAHNQLSNELHYTHNNPSGFYQVNYFYFFLFN